MLYKQKLWIESDYIISLPRLGRLQFKRAYLIPHPYKIMRYVINLTESV